MRAIEIGETKMKGRQMGGLERIKLRCRERRRMEKSCGRAPSTSAGHVRAINTASDFYILRLQSTYDFYFQIVQIFYMNRIFLRPNLID